MSGSGLDMRVAWKLALGVTFVIGGVLVVQGVARMRGLAVALESDLRDDELILSGTLAAAVADIWSSSGPEAAAAFLERVRDHWPRSVISLRVLPAGDAATPVLTEPSITAFRRGRAGVVRAAAPVVVGDQTVAVVEVARELSREGTAAAALRRNQLASSPTCQSSSSRRSGTSARTNARGTSGRWRC